MSKTEIAMSYLELVGTLQALKSPMKCSEVFGENFSSICSSQVHAILHTPILTQLLELQGLHSWWSGHPFHNWHLPSLLKTLLSSQSLHSPYFPRHRLCFLTYPHPCPLLLTMWFFHNSFYSWNLGHLWNILPLPSNTFIQIPFKTHVFWDTY